MSEEQVLAKNEYLNIFILRLVVYAGVCLSICLGLSMAEVDVSPGFYFFPFVIALSLIEYMCKKYNLAAKVFLNRRVLIFLCLYFTVYSLIFLYITDNAYMKKDLPAILLGHFLHFFGAVFFSSFYARIRARKK